VKVKTQKKTSRNLKENEFMSLLCKKAKKKIVRELKAEPDDNSMKVSF